MRTSWLTLGMFSAALAGGATPFQTRPLLTWFSLFLVRSSANFAKKIQELAEDKAENPRTCRGQSREQNPYRRLQENSNLKALFFLTPFLIANLLTAKTLNPPAHLWWCYGRVGCTYRILLCQTPSPKEKHQVRAFRRARRLWVPKLRVRAVFNR